MPIGSKIDRTEEKNLSSVIGYTAVPWESAMAVLRFTGPFEMGGVQIIQGNQGDQISPELVSLADMVLIQRDFPRFSDAYDTIVTQARQESKPVIYETDDCLLDIPEDHSHKGDYSGYLLPILRAMIEADAVTTSTPTLASYLHALNPNIVLLPNYLNDRLWPMHPARSLKDASELVVIGYMGGETHQADLELIAPALLQIIQKYGEGVCLKFWGGEPPQSLLELSQTQFIPLNQLDYTQFACFFSEQECDLFIAPLRDSFFNRCKSALKYLEYSSLAIPGVYSRLPAYESIIQPGVNGFLANSSEEWEVCLQTLIESPELRWQMGARAQETVSRDWLLSDHYREWQQIYPRMKMHQKTSPIPTSELINILLGVAQQTEQFQKELQKTDYQLQLSILNLNAQLTEQAQQFQVHLEEQARIIEQQQNQIQVSQAEVAHVRGQLNDVLNSRSWRFLKKVNQIRTKLIPHK